MLRAINASEDERRSELPVLRLKREMLRTIGELNARHPDMIIEGKTDRSGDAA